VAVILPRKDGVARKDVSRSWTWYVLDEAARLTEDSTEKQMIKETAHTKNFTWDINLPPFWDNQTHKKKFINLRKEIKMNMNMKYRR